MSVTTQQPFPIFLSELQERLKRLFSTMYTNEEATKRGMPRELFAEAFDPTPLSVFIPEQYGGRGQHVAESLSMLEACSYESLALSLTMGINGALFLQPVSKYAEPALQERVFERFINHKAIGGLMITEPEFGSDALRMRSSFKAVDGGYHLKGTKHWGGLTGHADFWLLTARGETERGDLERTISFFVWDKSLGGIEVEEYYPSLGLYMIPYGRSKLDTVLPADHRLSAKQGGVRMMLDLLHRSRLQFPGMAMGYLRRLLDEAVAYTRARNVGGFPLVGYDQVQDRLAELQAYTTACAAMCAYTSEAGSVAKDLSGEGLPANSIKTVITDYMQDAAQSVVQLFGGRGYRLDSIAGRSVVDSRPFQIFEGSNDILYQQISEAVLKRMGALKETNLFGFLKGFELSVDVVDRFQDALSFSFDRALSQRKMVELGRALGRLFSMQMVVTFGARGYHSELVQSCLDIMGRQVRSLLCSVSDSSSPVLVGGYEETPSWLDIVSAT
ncbi:MAG: acyl-CoA dehydrogenase [Spirochaetaceae bacterium]|nr:MAG: acyl-CoA dehydrogenase [Spirochaetaceae bacterium]